MTLLKESFRPILRLILWMGVIFSFSAMPSSGSSPDGLPLMLLLERKGAHVFEYLVLTLLSFDMFRKTLSERGVGRLTAYAALLSLSYAFSDEAHQLLVPGREGKLADVGIDAIGIALGMLLVGGFLSRERTRRQG